MDSSWCRFHSNCKNPQEKMKVKRNIRIYPKTGNDVMPNEIYVESVKLTSIIFEACFMQYAVLTFQCYVHNFFPRERENIFVIQCN